MESETIPQCRVSEQGMVGCIVASRGSVLDEYPLTESHFFTENPAAVFRAANSLHREGMEIDFFSVRGKLQKERHSIAEADLTDYLTYPSVLMAATFHSTLCEKLTLRKAQEMARWMTGNVNSVRDTVAFCGEVNSRAANLHIATNSDNLLQASVQNVLDRGERMLRGEKTRRMLMPILAWNRLFGGLSDGNYYGIASRPGMGKTAMMEQMLAAYMMSDRRVLCFEKDMSPQKLIERISCREAKVPFWKYDREMLEKHEIERVMKWASAINTSGLLLYSPVGLTAENMCAIVRREVRVNKIEAVFLDHIQCLRFAGRDIREGLTSASLSIRACATETGIPHVVLAHLNRDAAKPGRPQADQIKEFDQFYGDVDCLGILWSEVEQADVENGKDRPMKLYASKNRGGACTEEELLFDGPLLTFK